MEEDIHQHKVLIKSIETIGGIIIVLQQLSRECYTDAQTMYCIMRYLLQQIFGFIRNVII